MKNSEPRRGDWLTRKALFLGALLSSSIGVYAQAQSLPPDAPPVRAITDEFGVDDFTGQVMQNIQGISIGPDDGGLKFNPIVVNGQISRHNYTIFMIVNNNSVAIFLGGRTKTLYWDSGNYVDTQGAGNILTKVAVDHYELTEPDGTVTVFRKMTPWVDDLLADTITKPDGEKIRFYYASNDVVNRLQMVSSNRGYAIKFTYASNSGNPVADYLRITNVTAFNRAVDYCDSFANSCTFSRAWPSMDFAGVPESYTRTLTYSDGYQIVYKYQGGSNVGSRRLISIKRSASSSNDVEFSYDATSGRISAVTSGGHTKSYSYNLVANPKIYEMITSDDVGVLRSATLDLEDGPVKNRLLAESDGLGNTTSYTYGSFNRVTRVQRPEGDATEYTYDARGNVTQVKQTGKTGAIADIVTSAAYSTTCANTLTCNKPTSTTDELGNVTNYTYDSSTGQILTITRPAPTTGAARPKVTNTYVSLYARYKYLNPALSQAPTPVSVLSTSSTCLTGSTCSGTSSELKTTTTYEAGSPTVRSNVLPLSVNVKAGDNSLSATTAYAYDTVGNVTSVDGPLSGTADTTAYKYDSRRRVVGKIGPDPDGAGSNPNAAVRTTFDAWGRVSKVEQGTTAGQSDTAWASFSPDLYTLKTYDAVDRVLTDATRGSSTVHSLAQYSYDARGRVDCKALRMNPSIYGSLPTSACDQGTMGAFGKDRITKYAYDLADRVTQVKTAYGTAAEATEVTGYTANGAMAYQVDANGNRTSYAYDDHDRLSRTSYPVAAVGSDASSTTDYEELTYDAASNVTSRRLRDGNTIAMTYDALDRMVSRTPTGEPEVTFGYNLRDMPTTVQRASDSTNVTNSYDALGRLTSQAQKYGAVSYQYDLAGNRTRLTWGDGNYVVYDYDAASRVTKVRENGASSGVGVLATYAYDSRSRRGTVTYGNGTVRTYAWDGANRLAGLRVDLAGATDDQTIGLVGGVGAAIGYNPASQIMSITKSNDAYAYTGRVDVSRGYTTNGLNQYAVSGATSLGYDARGNLTTSGSNSYGYDLLNQMTSAPGVAMTYDGLGRLIAYNPGTSTRFVYDEGNPSAEYDASGNVLRRYVPGPGTDEIVVWYEGAALSNTTRRFLQGDERGSIIAVSDSAGNLVGVNSYDEFGIPASTNIGRFQYTGQTWYPELGMYSYKARIYAPTLGRFMQTDPIGYGDGLNWYTYVGGDPINKTDSSGLGDITVIGPKLADLECLGLTPDNCEALVRRLFGNGSEGGRSSGLITVKGIPQSGQSKNEGCFSRDGYSLNDYRDHHDRWVAREAQRLRSQGFLVATEVSISALSKANNGWITARADIMYRMPGSDAIFINEIKTGGGWFSRNQKIVYDAEGAVVRGFGGMPIGLRPGEPFPIANLTTTFCRGLGK